MKIALRAVLFLALALWFGAELFFPFVAAAAFRTVPDPQLAGAVVGRLLRTLHFFGFGAGIAALAALALSYGRGLYATPATLGLAALLAVLLALTAYSQFGIMPAMERDRVAVGGNIPKMPIDHPNRVHFDRLHKQSVRVEGAVLFGALGALLLLAFAESARD